MNGQFICIAVATGIMVVLLGWRLWGMFRSKPSRFDHPALFFFLVFAAMLALRLPGIKWMHEFHVDESQLVAQAMRYVSHPVPWRDVDGTTSGPLDSWLLSAPMLLGASATWATSRTVLWAADCATIFFLYLALRCFGTREDAQVALMPTILFNAFVINADFNGYSSEVLPALLISIMIWLLCRVWTRETFPMTSIICFGFLAGCVPFTKLQATPIAAFLAAAGLAEIIFKLRTNRAAKVFLMLMGAAIFPAALLGWVVRCGAGADFYKSYILQPMVYARSTLGEKTTALWALFIGTRDFGSYFASTLAAAILLLATWAYVRQPRPGSKLLVPLAGSLALGLVAFGCTATSGKAFTHYLLLLVPAMAIFTGLALAVGKALLLSPEENAPGLFPKPVHWYLAGFALVAGLQVIKVPGYLGAMRAFLSQTEYSRGRKSFVARRILQVSRPGDTMSVWGWMPSYYVETGLMPATRDAICHFIIEQGPYRDYYRQRYLHDLVANPPAIFVDAMSWGVFTYSWTSLEPHESFPELNSFITDNYSMWLSVHIITARGIGVPVRIYVLKQRMTTLHLEPGTINIPMDPLLAPE